MVIEFFNAFYLRHGLVGIRDYTPAHSSRGGVSEYFFWYPNLDDRKVLRTTSQIQGMSCVAVGNMLPFRDIVLVKIAINKTEDPADGMATMDVCMCFHAVKALKQRGIRELEMDANTAEDMKAVFDKFSEHHFGSGYKKELHVWLQQKHKGNENNGTIELTL